MFDLFSQFSEWILLFSSSAFVFIASQSDRKVLNLSLMLPPILFFVFLLAPFWFPNTNRISEVAHSESLLNIFYANVHSENESKELLVKYLQASKPDVVMLLETDLAWAEQLKSLRSIYPFSKAIFQDGNFGLAVLSRHELKVEKVFFDRENYIPALYLTIKAKGFSLRTLLLHAFPPIGEYGSLLRNRYLRTIAGVIAGDSGPLLVCGDFNLVPWASGFKEFLEFSGLKHPDSKPILRTWPAWFAALLPIDHCLVKNITTKKVNRGPNVGSDHWPLELQISLSRREPSSM